MPGDQQTVVFRADASRTIGGGHVMRCLALAEGFAALGWRCIIATRHQSSAVVPQALAHSWDVVYLADHEADDGQSVGERIGMTADLLVVDHYGLDAGFEAACRSWCARVVVIDDLANRPHDCDLLIDSGFGRSESDYRRWVNANAALELGTDYALLRREFFLRRPEALERRMANSEVRNINISFGATDPHAMTMVALSALARTGYSGVATVVLGAGAPARERICSLAAHVPFAIDLRLDETQMAYRLAEADLAIGAGGAGSWERCALGLPSLVVVTNSNQSGNARALDSTGAGRVIGKREDLTADAFEAALAAALADSSWRQATGRAAARLCDGLGVGRTLCALMPERAKTGATINLRRAVAADSSTIYEWQSHPGMRRYFRNPSPPTPAEHRSWMSGKIDDPRCLLMMIEAQGTAAGVLRFDRTDAQTCEVSILVAPGRSGCGIASAALRLGRRLLPWVTLTAAVHPENSGSRALFRAVGYCESQEQMMISVPAGTLAARCAADSLSVASGAGA